MKAGIGSSADLTAEGRWDAAFNLTKKSLVDDGSLKNTMAAILLTVDKALSGKDRLSAANNVAIDIMMSMPPSIRINAVKDLVRGSNGMRDYNTDKTIRDYPFLSVAIAYRDFDAEAILRKSIHELQEKLDKIKSISIKKP